MKRYGILALALVMCCALFTGCRRGNGNMRPVSPTNEATTEMPTMPTVMPETRPATEPSATAPTQGETTHATEGTTGGMEHGTTNSTEQGTTGAAEGNRSRTVPNQPAAR